MFEKFIEYVSEKLIDQLWNSYVRKKEERDMELTEITDEFGSVETLLKFYVEPNCQNINPANYNEEEPDAVTRTPVFDFLNKYLNREFVVQGDGRNQLFVLSDAGVGKSSLLLMIKLCNLLPDVTWEYSIENNRRVELIKLDAEALGKVRSVENKTETILLLDALDEDPLTWQKPEKRLLKILQASSKFRRVIISCRTQFFPEKGVRTHGTQDKISIGGYVCPLVFLSLFDEEQVIEYLEKRFPLDEFPDNSSKISKSIEILKKAKSLSFRPFLLSHVEDLLDSDDGNWTELSVYDELVSVWLKREIRKKSSLNFSEKDLWIACVAIAAKMQESGKRHLSKNALREIVKSIPEVEHINRIVYGSKSLLNRNSTGDYRFSHFSVQEYFLAKYVLALSNEKHGENTIKRIPVNRSSVRLTRKSLEFISYHHDSTWSYKDNFLLHDLVLDGFDFTEGNWTGCDFSRSTLRDANFNGAYLGHSNFTESILVGAVFDQSFCTNTYFSKADLSYASFVDVQSPGAIFIDSKFVNTNLKGLSDLGRLPKSTKFTNCSGQPFPDSTLGVSSATAGAIPPLL